MSRDSGEEPRSNGMRLLLSMMDVDPAGRCTMSEALESPVFHALRVTPDSSSRGGGGRRTLEYMHYYRGASSSSSSSSGDAPAKLLPLLKL